jgi:hypothetical protein
MIGRSNRISVYALAFALLTAGSFGAQSIAAETAGRDNTNQSRTESGRRHPSARRHSAGSNGSRHEQRSIIFVGGKKGSQGAATISNPTAAKKSNGTLNPQPIPPGKRKVG